MSHKSHLTIISDDLRRHLMHARGGAAGSVKAAFAVLRSYERLAGNVYALRRATNVSPETRSMAEDLLTSATHELIFSENSLPRSNSNESWRSRYRAVWRENLSLFWYTVMLFFASGVIGWGFAARHPEYTLVLLPQQLAENVLDHQQWFAKIQEAPLLAGLEIAINNIMVCIRAFCLGILFGVGGLGILCFNGLHIGALLGYCYAQGFYGPLQAFTLSHGPLELTIIIASAFSSLLYGRAFFMRPYRHFGAHLADGAKDAFIVLVGITPWLVLAATLEAFVSPFPWIPVSAKFTMGITAAALFWGWTFWPVRSSPSKPQGSGEAVGKYGRTYRANTPQE